MLWRLRVKKPVAIIVLSLMLLSPLCANSVKAEDKPNRLTRIIDTFNLKLKVFEQANSSIGSALGMRFSYDEPQLWHNEPNSSHRDSHSRVDFFYGLSARGNIAFNSRNNPENFLQSYLATGFQLSRSRPLSLSVKQSKKEQELAQEMSRLDSADPRYQTLQQQLEQWPLSRASSLSLEGRVFTGLESDQKFTKKQRVSGLSFTTHYQNYQRALNFASSPWPAKLNLLDYPFALLRMVSEQKFLPSAASLPSLELAYSRVQPRDDDPRSLAGDRSPFFRFHISLSFKTRLGLEDKAHNPIYFTAHTRYFKERRAKQSTIEAGLDSYHYSVFTIEGSNTYLSYARGKLPLDARENVVYEIGWKYNL